MQLHDKGGMAMKTMKALVKAKKQKGLWLQEVPVPGVGKNEVLIEQVGAGNSEKHFPGSGKRQMKIRKKLEFRQYRAVARGHDQTEK